MGSTAPSTPLRQLLEDRFSQIQGDVESFVNDARDQARRELAEELNQSARRIAQASGDEEIAVTLADVASRFAAGAIVFKIRNGDALALAIRGTPEETLERFRGLEISLRDAAAIAGAVESREPVVAVTSEAEVSRPVLERLQHPADGRVHIAEAPPQVHPELLQIAPARPALTWESLPPAEQQIHLRAQRFARVQVADIRLHDGDTVQRGRARKNLYGTLRERIDRAREAFRKEFFANCPSMVDYLHLELVRTLANDDADALGKEYPGPLV
jgi:hypothetical protein